MTRFRFEATIKSHMDSDERSLSGALYTLIRRHGLSWFTDEQIADIRAVMVKAAWRADRDAMASRKIHAARRAA